MPAISFNTEFLDALLRGDKQQTTRKQTDRVKVGDTAHIYIEQRSRITDKPIRRATLIGEETIIEKIRSGQYPPILDEVYATEYYAHFLGQVVVTGVVNIRPCEMGGDDLKEWARADGFKDFHPTVMPPARLYDGANMWFQQRYGDDWMQRMWTVIQWDGWAERYFEPEL